MDVNNRIIVTAPVSSVGTGDAVGGSRSPVPLGAAQGRCDVEAPQKTVATSNVAGLDRRGGTEATKTVSFSRPQAEARYSKTLEEINKHLTLLEKTFKPPQTLERTSKVALRTLACV